MLLLNTKKYYANLLLQTRALLVISSFLARNKCLINRYWYQIAGIHYSGGQVGGGVTRWRE